MYYNVCPAASVQFHYDNQQRQNFANVVHPEPPQAFRPQIDYNEPPVYAPPTNMYNQEYGNRPLYPYHNRSTPWRRRSHLDDIYYPNYDAEDDYYDYNPSYNERIRYNRYGHNSPRLQNANRFPTRKRNKRANTMIKVVPNSGGTKVDKEDPKDKCGDEKEVEVDSSECENANGFLLKKKKRVLPLISDDDSEEVEEEPNKQQTGGPSSEDKLGLESNVEAAKGVNKLPKKKRKKRKSPSILTNKVDSESTKATEGGEKESKCKLQNHKSDREKDKELESAIAATSSPSVDQNIKAVAGKTNNVDPPTDCTRDDVLVDKFHQTSHDFVDSAMLKLGRVSPIAETTERPKKLGIGTINFTQILSNLNGIFPESQQSDKLQATETSPKSMNSTTETAATSSDDLLALLQSSPSCNSAGLVDVQNNNLGEYPETSSKIVEKLVEADDPSKLEKYSYFPTLANYSIPKRVAKHTFSDTNELYLNRMHTLFGSDNSDSDEINTITSKTKTSNSKENLVDKYDWKSKTNKKKSKLINKCTKHKVTTKRRQCVDIQRSPKLQDSDKKIVTDTKTIEKISVEVSKSPTNKAEFKVIENKRESFESPRLQMSESKPTNKSTTELKVIEKRRESVEVARSPKIQGLETKPTTKNSTELKTIEKRRQSLNKPINKNMVDLQRSPKMQNSECKPTPSLNKSLDKHSTTNDTIYTKDSKPNKTLEKIGRKRSHNLEATSGKRRCAFASGSQSKSLNKEAMVQLKDIEKVKSPLLTKLDNVAQKLASTTVENVERSPTTKLDKVLTSCNFGVLSSETIAFFNCAPLSPFRSPSRQTISGCNIVLDDCCDEATILEQPDIKELVQIVVNTSVKHVAKEVIEIKPEIPLIDLTEDGDDKATPPIPAGAPKQELLDILKEGVDRSAVSSPNNITLYRSDETLNNSLEIQATSASISVAAVLPSGEKREVKRKCLKAEDDSGVDMNESEEEGSKISNVVVSQIRKVATVVDVNSSSGNNVLPALLPESSVVPPNTTVFDTPSSTEVTEDNSTPPALQSINSYQPQTDGAQRFQERSPPPPYPSLRNVRISFRKPVNNPLTHQANKQPPPYDAAIHRADNVQGGLSVGDTLEVYKRDYNNLGTVLVEYLLFLLNMRKAQVLYVDTLKKTCITSPRLLTNEVQCFQVYSKNNMVELSKNLRKKVETLNLSSFMRMAAVPLFLKAIEISIFKLSSLASKTTITFWLHSLMVEHEDYYAWHGSFCCIYKYLVAAVDKLMGRNQNNQAIGADPLSPQQRRLLHYQIVEYNKICANIILSTHTPDKPASHTATTVDSNTNTSYPATTRKSQTDKIDDNSFQRIRLPRSLPYDVQVSVASTNTLASSSAGTIVAGATSSSGAAALMSFGYPSTKSTVVTTSCGYSCHLANTSAQPKVLNLSTTNNPVNVTPRNSSAIYSQLHASAPTNSPACTTNKSTPTQAVTYSPARTLSTSNLPAHTVSSNAVSPDGSHMFRPPQVQLKFRCPTNRPQPTSPASATNSNVNEALMLKTLLTSGASVKENGSSSDLHDKSPVYAPMLFSPSSYECAESEEDDAIETIDLTWVDDVDEQHLQMELEYLVKKEEPVDEDEVILNQEQFPVTPSPTDSGIESPPIQSEINELYTNRTCICGKRAEYICGCRMAMYCSLPCQKRDWASHKAICLKYTAKTKETPINSGQLQ